MCSRDVEAEAGSGPFSVKAEAKARKIHRFHIGGKNGERKEIGSAILRRRTNRGAQTLRNESEEKLFREMLTST